MQSIRYHDHINPNIIQSSIENVEKRFLPARQTGDFCVFFVRVGVYSNNAVVSQVFESNSDLATSTGQIENFIVDFEMWVMLWYQFFLDETLDIVFVRILVLVSALKVVLLDSLLLVDLAKASLHQLSNIITINSFGEQF
jgi:hypothetical protein